MSDLRIMLDAVEAEVATWPEAKTADELAEQYQRRWELLPRIKYPDLPDSMKKRVIDTVSYDDLRNFSIDMCGADVQAIFLSESETNLVLQEVRESAVYTIENIDAAPVLYGDNAMKAFYDVAHKILNHEMPPIKKRRRVNNIDKYAVGGNYQMIPSDERYQHAFSTQRNNYAYLAVMPTDEEFIQQFSFKDGILSYNNSMAAILKQYRKGQYEDISHLDFPVLVQIYTAAIKTAKRQEGHSIIVSIPAFFKEMGIDTQKGNATNALSIIKQFESCWAVMPQRGLIYKLLSIQGFDVKTQEMTIDVPYFYKLKEVLIEDNTVKKKLKDGSELIYINPHYNELIHSNIAKERNKTAIEVVYYITNALLQRGFISDSDTYRNRRKQTNSKDDVITYSVSYRTIINECPVFRARLQSTPNRNVVLTRTFQKAFELLNSKTDVNSYFVDVTIKSIVPTMKTLDTKLIITHNGKNTNYQPMQ